MGSLIFHGQAHFSFEPKAVAFILAILSFFSAFNGFLHISSTFVFIGRFKTKENLPMAEVHGFKVQTVWKEKCLVSQFYDK